CHDTDPTDPSVRDGRRWPSGWKGLRSIQTWSTVTPTTTTTGIAPDERRSAAEPSFRGDVRLRACMQRPTLNYAGHVSRAGPSQSHGATPRSAAAVVVPGADRRRGRTLLGCRLS